LREEAPVLPTHIKESVMVAIRADAFSVNRGFAWRYAIGFGAFLILGAGGTVYAAQLVNPGNILYPVKRASETAYVGIQPSPKAQAGVQQILIDRRFLEAEMIADNDNDIDFDNDLVTAQLADDAADASEAWILAQEQIFSNDIQLAASR
jgi:hypothetical protein